MKSRILYMSFVLWVDSFKKVVFYGIMICLTLYGCCTLILWKLFSQLVWMCLWLVRQTSLLWTESCLRIECVDHLYRGQNHVWGLNVWIIFTVDRIMFEDWMCGSSLPWTESCLRIECVDHLYRGQNHVWGSNVWIIFTVDRIMFEDWMYGSSLLWTESCLRIECVYDYTETIIFTMDRLIFQDWMCLWFQWDTYLCCWQTHVWVKIPRWYHTYS